MAGATLEIKEKDRKIEIFINGNLVDNKFLKSINLNMEALESNVLTLEYHVQDIDIAMDSARVRALCKG